MIKLLAISSSPVKNGNGEYLTSHMVQTAEQLGCDAQCFYLSQMKIEECLHCNACIGKQKIGKYCVIEDDAQKIFEAVEGSDIILLSSPVYHMRMNARMAAFTDRLRVFIFGNISGNKMKNKVGISAAVAWKRHGGFETTHLSHMYVFYNLDMLPVGCHHSISPLGASAVSSRHGHGLFEKEVRCGVSEDAEGLKSGEMLVKRAIDVAKALGSKK
ncbi:MAG: flavodoxin family protein [Proteobacteria bacterium]|nr:flavodoxin family protein [Pseudomonadota bacterium]MBU1585327.1 flavodoxin family protein [Pseudomonadota bacterium]MBU2455491.1 flavodoxin family protein [Pseudomonadota bacterium]MBU2631733.1 flavodoxin family protein [Pseudomonadota bacterium]